MFSRKCFKLVEQYISNSENLTILWVTMRAPYDSHLKPLTREAIFEDLSEAGTLKECLKEVL